MSTRIIKPPRYELKVVADYELFNQIKSWLRVHPAVFFVIYPHRQINNVYFDAHSLASYEENISGISTRKKVRLRWYGESSSDIQGIFEIKFRRNFFGWKVLSPLSKVVDLSKFSWSEIGAVIRGDLPEDLILHFENRCLPVLINRYFREYYISWDRLVRVTVDYPQKIYDQRHSIIPNLNYLTPSPKTVVVEFKANVEHRERLFEVVSDFPLPVNKNSKYSICLGNLLNY